MKVVGLLALRTGRLYTPENIPGKHSCSQWLRCCATDQNVAGSIPAGVNGFFIDIKSFRSHYGPGVDSASNRNEYREYFLGGKSGRCVRLTTYHHPVPLSRNLGALTSWNPLGLSRPVMGLFYLYLLHIPVRSWVNRRDVLQPEGLFPWKIPMTPSGIESGLYSSASTNWATACHFQTKWIVK